MTRSCLAAAAAAFALLIAADAGAPASAQTRPRVYLGALSCNVSAGDSFIFGSTKDLSCVFLTTAGTSTLYQGTIHRYGIDIGYSKAVHNVFHVFSLGSDRGLGALDGSYPGTQETIGLGVAGGGGNVLLGGQDREIVLQSAGVQQNVGFNFAEGVAELSLRRGS